MLIDAGAGSHNLTAAEFSGPTGLEVRAPSQIISGNIANTTTAGLRLNGGSGNFSLQMFNNTGYQVDFASEVGPSVIFANSANPLAGTMFNGTPSQLDFIFIDFGGGASNRYISFPIQTVHVAGWSPQFPQSNAVMAVVNDMSQTGNLHATNLTLSSSAQVGSSTFASLGAGANGSLLYCSDCVPTSPCAGGGTGALAAYVNGTWSCGGTGGGSSYTFRDELTNTSGTVDFNPFDPTFFLVEEFMPSFRPQFGIGSLGWSVAYIVGAAGSFYFSTDAGNHPGILNMTPDAAAGHGITATLTDTYDQASGVMPLANMGTGGAFTSWEMQAIVQTDSKGNGVSHGTYSVGFSDNISAYHPANGNSIAVRYDSAGGGCSSGESTTHWVYEVVVAGAQYCVDSGVTVAAATWYKIRIYSTTPGTINFQIGVNGAALGNNGTIAQAPTVNLTPEFMALTTSAAYQYLSVDRWAMKIRGLNR